MKSIRFLYINSFAFLLMGLGAGIFLVPTDVFLMILKTIAALWCAAGGVVILFQWKSKARKMVILLARNKKELRPDTFKKLTGTLCGQLMARLTLADLRKTEVYRDLPDEEWNAAKRKVLGKRGKAGRNERKPPLAV
jgi:hypothetical protein